jgi:hypothetical protein
VERKQRKSKKNAPQWHYPLAISELPQQVICLLATKPIFVTRLKKSNRIWKRKKAEPKTK